LIATKRQKRARIWAAEGLPMVTESMLMGETSNASAVLAVGHEPVAALAL
jgi:hypothetical protein